MYDNLQLSHSFKAGLSMAVNNCKSDVQVNRTKMSNLEIFAQISEFDLSLLYMYFLNLLHIQDVLNVQFLSDVKLVWIQSFAKSFHQDLNSVLRVYF